MMIAGRSNDEALTGGDSIPRFGELSKLIPVCLVHSIIVFMYVLYVLLHCFRLLQLDLPAFARDDVAFRRGLWQLIVFHLITGLLLYCLVKCLLTFPGTVPSGQGWELRGEGEEGAEIKVAEKKTSGERRHCKWCLKYKPDRCHHCRICNMCVLRMDHHCPWVYNCIGFRNHKYFLLLLFYAVLDVVFIAITMFETVWWSTRTDVSPSMMLILAFGECFACFLAIATGLFLCFHIWLALKGMTTLEFCEKSMKLKSYDSSLYSAGWLADLSAVLGPHPLLWLLPISLPTGDGMTWNEQ
eukprot:TRINITY_DN35593_c0_g1_i1.p1 TRINITY_DN35593_c0_g1~~TRINITY_DN35593_c0_g1_i1.p1  ORF type:complete len:298 (+),score=26.61 TRINITY_DN35593_c0_g1_i1:35-928(+)